MLDKQKIIDELAPTLGEKAARKLADVLGQLYDEFCPRKVKEAPAGGQGTAQETKEAPSDAARGAEPAGPAPAVPPVAQTQPSSKV
jgi:hypothetical protein